MARQPRFVVAGLAHLLSLPALSGVDPFPTDDDKALFLAVVRGQANLEHLQLHAYALLPAEVRLLATPGSAQALSRFVQAVGRRYVSAYNRAHERSGTIWSGRFRCAAIEAGAWTLRALRFVDGASTEPNTTSAQLRTGGLREGTVTDPPPYWELGNTPFERERAYAQLLSDPIAEADITRIRRCLSGGRPCGTDGFVRLLEAQFGHPIDPRPRGRPPRSVNPRPA